MQLPAAVGGRKRVPRSLLDFPLFILNTFGIEINAQKLNVSLAESPFVKPFFRGSSISPLQFFFFPWILNQWADDNMNNSSTVLQVWAKALRVNHKSTQRKTNKLLRESNRAPRTPRQGSTLPLHAATLCSLTKVAVQ